MNTPQAPTPASQSTAAATDINEFITDLDGGQFERMLSVALSQSAAATEKQVAMAAKLYEIRETARRLLGDVFKQRMAEVGQMLTEAAERNNCDPLAVAIRMSKNSKLSGTDVLMMMAAAVELEEPTP